MSTFNFKQISGGYTPRPPLKGEGRGEGKERRGRGKGGEAPQFTFLATPLQLLTDFQKSFTGRFLDKFAVQ